MSATTLPTADQIDAVRHRIAGYAIRTPLIRLGGSATDIYLKLENLQPIGSFKVRGAAAVLTAADPETLEAGVVTASAGNMGQGAAWVARELGIACTVLVPPTAPEAKVEAIETLGATVMRITAEQWWQAFEDRQFEAVPGVFVHAFDDPYVMAGNATIAYEIAEDRPDVAAVLTPWGGGGLSCGVAVGLAAKAPAAKVFAAEVASAAPYAASHRAGHPMSIAYEPSFVDGIGSPTVIARMFEAAQSLGVGSVTADLDHVAAAVRTLAVRNRVIAEGAGATPVACALNPSDELTNAAATGPIVCVVSGGMIGMSTLLGLLKHE